MWKFLPFSVEDIGKIAAFQTHQRLEKLIRGFNLFPERNFSSFLSAEFSVYPLDQAETRSSFYYFFSGSIYSSVFMKSYNRRWDMRVLYLLCHRFLRARMTYYMLCICGFTKQWRVFNIHEKKKARFSCLVQSVPDLPSPYFSHSIIKLNICGTVDSRPREFIPLFAFSKCTGLPLDEIFFCNFWGSA